MAKGAQRAVANCVVVGIEEVAEGRIETAIAREMFGKQKRFEEPCGVRQMPLCGTRIRHGLQGLVLNRQGRTTSRRSATDAKVLLLQANAVGRQKWAGRISNCRSAFHNWSKNGDRKFADASRQDARLSQKLQILGDWLEIWIVTD